ncbi:uncharacterized protein LOC126926582 [Bombus affinis]|uniref:uncharacterized protein LOC126926582 n=1 Tax=Bombus affinis TaxID=309941 RepID=UPI0021B83386|nr:uncharacterized protein LOC126926582 [Bombus affinis]
MLKKNIIEPTDSPYYSPVWVVPKKQAAPGKQIWRIVIDIRKLNELTDQDAYPLPDIDDILSQLGSGKFFSALDLSSGFHQIPMDPESKKYTALSTSQGHYHCNRMPLRLKNAPVTFQRMRNTVLRGLTNKHCFAYLDDIIIFAQSIEEHNQNLSIVLQRLRELGFKIQPDKCEFLKEELEYLGHILKAKGVKANPKKIEVVKNIRHPKNPTEVKSFLGLADLQSEWNRYFSQLALINNIRFPRKKIGPADIKVELHGLSDDSEEAYGACVYLRTVCSDGTIQTRLLNAKSKVASLKTLTIPRLELSGALRLASLISSVQKALTIKIAQIVYWTDSTIVLQWIKSSPHMLKTLVVNRVAEIQTKTNISDWRHVPTADNPADLISRGQTPKEFLRPSIWKNEPEWLQQTEEHWPIWNPLPLVEAPEQKVSTCLVASPIDHTILEKYSPCSILIRVVVRCLRWRHKLNRVASLTVAELTSAENKLVRLLQSIHFSKEIRTLQKDPNTAVGGKLQCLNPFLDNEGILRIGGRVSNSPIPLHQKHPTILPKSSVTELIIDQVHRRNHHSGTQATLYAVRQRYWLVDGRNQVWRTIKRCVRCCRANPPSVEYLMGDLPESHITESPPFTNIEIDYCGPSYIKERRHRNRRKIKVYVAIFICLATKAVHIEVVSDLTIDAFFAAFRRFIFQRGHCATILLDNGTNFVGANKELKEFHLLL